MAYIRELGKDRWRAQVERAGVRRSAVRETRRAAEDWAAREEAALLDAKRGVYPANTLTQPPVQPPAVAASFVAGMYFRLRIQAATGSRLL